MKLHRKVFVAVVVAVLCVLAAGVVVQAQAPVITPADLPEGQAGEYYTFQFEAAGAQPMTWDAWLPSLPAGLTVSPGGLLSGIPTEHGTFGIEVDVENAYGHVWREFHLVIHPHVNAPKITTDVYLPYARLGEPYQFQFEAVGPQPITWDMAWYWEALPPGLTLSPGGLLSGTPTEYGVFGLELVAENAYGRVRQGFALTVLPHINAPEVTTAEQLPTGEINQPYQFQLEATGAQPLIWDIWPASLPAWLTLSPDGLLSGTPTEHGTFWLQVDVSNAYGQVWVGFELTIHPHANAPSITTEGGYLPIGRVGEPYHFQFEAAGLSPVAWHVGPASLPAGLTLSPDGLLSGTSTQSGLFWLTVEVENAYGRDGRLFLLSIRPQNAPIITTVPRVLHARVGAPYQFQFEATGAQPMTWDALPYAGLTLSPDGLFSGTPTQSGWFEITLEVRNAYGYASHSLLLVVSPDTGRMTIADAVTLAQHIQYGGVLPEDLAAWLAYINSSGADGEDLTALLYILTGN